LAATGAIRQPGIRDYNSPANLRISRRSAMRFLLNITMPIEKANAKMKDGTFPKDIDAILGN
jgi:hypothetical protein